MITELHPDWEIRIDGIDHRYTFEEDYSRIPTLLCTGERFSFSAPNYYVLFRSRYIIKAAPGVTSIQAESEGKLVTDHSPCTLCERRLLLDELGD